MSRTLRTALTAISIALALAACGPASNDDDAATPATNTIATDAPAETAAPEQAAAEGDEIGEPTPTPERTPVVADTDDEATQPDAAVELTSAPAPAPVPEHRRCSVSQAADGGEFRVEGIKADDPDGGLTVRTYAGYGYEQIGLLLEGEVVGSYYDEVPMPSCLITRDGNVWWEIHHASLPVGGWVNARYLTIHFGNEPIAPDTPVAPEPELPEEEPDAHGDCVYLPDLPETCVLVFRMGGEIVEVPAYDDELYHELLHACVYQGFDGACEVLAYEGQDIGTHLPLLSDDDVLKMCSEDGAKGKVGCAELDRRATNGLLDI